MRRRWAWLAVPALALGLVAAGCGGSDDSGGPVETVTVTEESASDPPEPSADMQQRAREGTALVRAMQVSNERVAARATALDACRGSAICTFAAMAALGETAAEARRAIEPQARRVRFRCLRSAGLMYLGTLGRTASAATRFEEGDIAASHQQMQSLTEVVSTLSGKLEDCAAEIAAEIAGTE